MPLSKISMQCFRIGTWICAYWLRFASAPSRRIAHHVKINDTTKIMRSSMAAITNPGKALTWLSRVHEVDGSAANAAKDSQNKKEHHRTPFVIYRLTTTDFSKALQLPFVLAYLEPFPTWSHSNPPPRFQTGSLLLDSSPHRAPPQTHR